MADQPVRVRLVGDLRVESGAEVVRGPQLGSRKARTLLALLAATPEHTYTADEIAAVLWPKDEPANAARVIASLVSRLRSAVASELIGGSPAGYRLGDVQVDIDRATTLVAGAERRLAAEPGLSAAAATAALDLLTGTPLADADGEWAHAVRARHAGTTRRARLVLARARTAVGDHSGAAEVAREALAADPLDEEAARALMAALAAAGETAAALRVFDAVRADLADELGIDPAPATTDLRLRIIRSDVQRSDRSGENSAHVDGLIGRDREFTELRRLWSAAVGGTGSLVLLTGVAGAGKTRLATELARVVGDLGGDVLEARCYEAEHALFLQPLVEILTSAARIMPPERLRDASAYHRGTLARLVPALITVLGAPEPGRVRAEIGRRRAAEAIAGVLSGLARDRPLLVVLDDLHNAGTSTLEVLHFLRTILPTAQLLVVTTVRAEEGAQAISALAPVAHEIPVGPLAPGAVRTLAAAAGQSHRASEIAQRTGGHALFVTEILRADFGTLPTSLRSAVLTRVTRAGPGVEPLLRAAAVLGAAFDPRHAAILAGVPIATALGELERALHAGLLRVTGRQYEFSNDLVREVLYAATPEPARTAFHTTAIDLMVDSPEQVAVHAAAIADWPRATRALLLAADNALTSFAAADAASLAGRALAAAAHTGDDELRGRALLARGQARDVLADFAGAWDDFNAAEQAALSSGDRRLEMAVLREQAGNVPVALGYPPTVNELPLQRCLRLAAQLGDRVTEVDIIARLTVLSVSRLDFVEALRLVEQGLHAATASEQDEVRIRALDAAKTTNAYLGEVRELARVVAELEPMLRRTGDLYRLQWAVFESAFIPLAAGDHAGAVARIEEALAINRRSGYTPLEPFYAAHLAWVQRLQGDLGTAAATGARAVAMAREHRHDWWLSTATAVHGTTLIQLGRRGDAANLLEAVRGELPADGAQGYRVRCVAPLAEATGSAEFLDEADALLRSMRTPPGYAWLAGADAYLSVARAWRNRNEPERARAVVTPFRAAARRAGWVELVRLADELR